MHAPFTFKGLVILLMTNNRIALLIPVVVCAGIVYLNAVHADFLSLDDRALLDYLQSTELSLSSLLSGGADYFRPLPFISFSLDLSLFGRNPLAFHLANIFIHTLNAILVFFLSLRLSTCKDDSERAAFISSIFFLLHPVNTEAAMWVAGRYDLLCCFFFLLTLLIAFDKKLGELKAGLGIFIISLLSLLSKEASLGLPLIVICYFISDRHKYQFRRSAIISAMLISATLIYMMMRSGINKTVDTGIVKVISAGSRKPFYIFLYDSAAAFGFYIKKLIYPFPLSFAIVSINQSLWFILFFVFLVVALFLFIRFSDFRLPLLILLVSIIPPIFALHGKLPWTPYAERYLYVPMIGMALLVGRSSLHLKECYRIGIVVFVLLMGIPTIFRVALWSDSKLFWEDVLNKSPDFPRAYVGLAVERVNEGRYDEAEILLNKALTMGEDRNFVWKNLAAIQLARHDLEQYEMAQKKAAELSPRSTDQYIALAQTLMKYSGTTEDKVATYRRVAKYYVMAYEKDKQYVDGLYCAAKVYLQIDEREEALKYFKLFLEQQGETMYKPFARKLVAKIESEKRINGVK